MPETPYESPSPNPITALPAERTGRSGLNSRVVLCLAGAVLVPIVLQSLYLYLSRITNADSGEGDIAALIGSGFSGLVLLGITPVAKLVRLGLAVLYVPAMGGGLILYAMLFLVAVFGVSI